MSSTSRRFEKLARRFYTRHLVRLAEARRRDGREAFPLAPDPEQASYYVAPIRSRPERAAMQQDVTASTERFLAALEADWRARGQDDMVEALADLEALAVAARALAAEIEESEEVSPFVYAMF